MKEFIKTMAYCTNCGNKLGEGAKFCTNCGKPVTAAFHNTGSDTEKPRAAAPNTGSNAEKTKTASACKKFKTYYSGRTDYSRFKNVRLVSNPSQHKAHVAVTIIDFIVVIFLLIVLFKMVQVSDIEIIKSMPPAVYASVLITIICEIILRKIRYDIIHALPRGFDYWHIRRLLKWQVFGFNTLVTGVLRLLKITDRNFPELGFGNDDEGNYYAFAVDGEDADKYTFYTEFRDSRS